LLARRLGGSLWARFISEKVGMKKWVHFFIVECPMDKHTLRTPRRYE
jgi:hypothetical protein